MPSRAQTTDSVDVASDAEKVLSVLLEHVDESKTIWVALKAAHGATGNISSILDGVNAANGAYASGEVPADESIERIRDFVTKESSVLATLAQKTANNWLTESGVNSFDTSTFPAAEAYLDEWSQRLTTLKELIEDVLPLQNAIETALDAKGVVQVATTTNTTAALGNGMAISDSIFPRLGGCSTKIDVILSQLRLARSDIEARPALNPQHADDSSIQRSPTTVGIPSSPPAGLTRPVPSTPGLPTLVLPPVPKDCKSTVVATDASGYQYRVYSCQ